MAFTARLKTLFGGTADDPVTVTDAPVADPVETRAPRRVRRDDDPTPDTISTCAGCQWWTARSDSPGVGHCHLNPQPTRTHGNSYCSFFSLR
jgi:hypothetical protein